MAAPESIIKKHATYLEGWIQSCNDNHGDDCQVDPIAGRPPHHIPDWVIDTEDGCIVRGCSIQRYVALSYVWSSAAKEEVGGTPATEDRLMLQKDNLADFCRQGFLRSRILGRVPVVIRDAIDFVQLSGFRYLWVDSLCIVQHEATTRARVGLMNEIYSGAYFTIIAAASTEGLYGNEDYDDGHLPLKGISATELHSKLLCSHWGSRSWTFQEQLLSKRSIVFLDDVCFWDCQREVQWPSSPKNENTDLRGFSREESQELTSPSPIPDFKFYIELVCRYSNRNLTYDQDVLPAFSGVLEALSRRTFRGGFICGLPALFLDSALLWQPLVKARRRAPVGTATKVAPMAPLPSWSWAGWQCLVDPYSLK
ncbi:heterokaryon incompatibility protein-domain-containing protein [Diaporthe sp. PMI_573]|nr:heterokaryon incompatibility protein-domain-containing protein [Diaporthaceae sp. PMI_573]